MKQEDFERLRAVCEKEGFWVDDNHSLGLFHIMVKDIWDGVEFCTDGIKVYKIDNRTENWVHYHYLGKIDRANYSFLKPSTEQAYIEQLKKEAHERFGDIKEGDRFINTKNLEVEASKRWNDEYDKDRDLFFCKGVYLYQQGKWATRVKERVNVGLIHETLSNNPTYQFKLTNWNETNKAKNSGQFLAYQLEAYLNLDGYSVDVSGETLSIHVKIRNGVDLEDLKEKAESLAKIVKKI